MKARVDRAKGSAGKFAAAAAMLTPVPTPVPTPVLATRLPAVLARVTARRTTWPDLMRRMVLLMVIALPLAGGSVSSLAREGGAGENGRAAPRDLRDDLRHDLRKSADGEAARSANGCGGPCRMSAEERRQLRRDVHEAGRDLYRNEARSRMRERHSE